MKYIIQIDTSLEWKNLLVMNQISHARILLKVLEEDQPELSYRIYDANTDKIV